MNDYQLVCLKNGVDLFKFLDLVPNVSLIILDINMPDLNGIDILLELKTIEKFRHIPVVMLSTARNPKENLTVRGLGSAIILKPTSYTETLTLATRLLEYCK
jgi:CheY-like chemotaxis protein